MRVSYPSDFTDFLETSGAPFTRIYSAKRRGP